MRHRILAIDDDVENLESTREVLETWGYHVDAVSTVQEGFDLATNAFIQYAVILLDFQMPELTGAELAEKIRSVTPESVLLMYSCDSSREALKESFRVGVADFVDKDESLENLRLAVAAACRKYDLLRTYKLGETPKEAQSLMKSVGMIGCSDKMAEVARSCLKYRNVLMPILILGETGVGKEVTAHAIHKGDPKKFFAVNCAAFANRNLIESELFGYEKGAFTGAEKSTAGIFEVAQDGTVFLDELDQLSMPAQAALLRAIRERKIRRLGTSVEAEIRCRIIAAAKPAIRQKIKDGTFLPDLYFRFMMQIEVPPLRERKEDIGPLVEFFRQKYEAQTGTAMTFRERTIRGLESYDWPGNVGELEGYVYQLLINSNGGIVGPSMLDTRFKVDELSDDEANTSDLKTFLAFQKRQKRDFVISTIRKSESRRHAAERLGVNESTLRGIIAGTK